MQTISISYTLKWRFKNYPYIQITECKKVINTLNGRIKKQVFNGGSIGYWIGKQFIVKKKLNSYIELIPKESCPF
jgi:hypothetical protein